MAKEWADANDVAVGRASQVGHGMRRLGLAPQKDEMWKRSWKPGLH